MDEKYRTYLVRYRYEGAEWGAEIMARDFADAQARLNQLALGRIDGELVMNIPAAVGPLASLICWIRNSFWRVAGAR